MISFLIIMGLIFIIGGIILALPGIGIGTFIPLAGDIIDIPLSAGLILVGLAMLITGVGMWFAQYVVTKLWYISIPLIIFLLLLYMGKITWGIKRRR